MCVKLAVHTILRTGDRSVRRRGMRKVEGGCERTAGRWESSKRKALASAGVAVLGLPCPAEAMHHTIHAHVGTTAPALLAPLQLTARSWLDQKCSRRTLLSILPEPFFGSSLSENSIRRGTL